MRARLQIYSQLELLCYSRDLNSFSLMSELKDKNELSISNVDKLSNFFNELKKRNFDICLIYMKKELSSKEVDSIIAHSKQTPSAFLWVGDQISNEIFSKIHTQRNSLYLDEKAVSQEVLISVCRSLKARDSSVISIDGQESSQSQRREENFFLAKISHEIRTPLNGMLGMISLLKTTSLNSEQKDFLETVETSGASLLKLISDILDFSKVEAGKVVLENIDFSLNELIESTIGLYAEQCSHKDIFVTNISERNIPARISGDPTRLRQIVSNLLNNALKFTQKGEILVRARLLETQPPLIQVEVKDTGPGIEDAKLNKIFNVFSQADNSTTRKYGGTGLGLSICSQLVYLMGGNFEVFSKVGTGTTFKFTLPANNLQYEDRDLILKGKKVLVYGKKPHVQQRIAEQIKLQGGETVFGDSIEGLVSRQGDDSILAESDMLIIDLDSYGAEKKKTWSRIIKRLSSTKLPLLAILPQGKKDEWVFKEKGKFSIIRNPLCQSKLYQTISKYLKEGAEFGPHQKVSSKTVPTIEDTLSQEDWPVVLVAEDNPINQKVLGGILLRLQCRVDLVSNGEECIEAFKSGQYACIFMDCEMPKVDGKEATKKIRSLKKGSEIPIIAVTANASEEEAKLCFKSGMNDFLTKPVAVDRVKACMQKWVSFGGQRKDGSQEKEVGHVANVLSTPSTGFENNLLNFKTVKSLIALDAPEPPLLLADLIRTFESRVPTLLGEIEEKIKAKNAELVMKGAHQLKGMCSNIGAEEMSQMAYHLEEMGHQNEIEGAHEIMRQIKEAYKPTLNQLWTLHKKAA